MTYWEQILSVLSDLEKDWFIARWLKVLLINSEFNNTVVSKIIFILHNSKKRIKNENTKKKIIKSIYILSQLRLKEMEIPQNKLIKLKKIVYSNSTVN